eukprot:jgi/Mesvir1/26206/Mv02390-RA.1
MDVRELMGECDRWTLATDAKLLCALQKFSTSFLRRIDETTRAVEQLDEELSSLRIRTNNAYMHFRALSNTQFMENRVEDAVSMPEGSVAGGYVDAAQISMGMSSAVLPLAPGSRHASTGAAPATMSPQDPMPHGAAPLQGDTGAGAREHYRVAVRTAVDVLLAGGRHAAGSSSHIFPAIGVDRYAHRPLPPLIGSREFLEDPACGLSALEEHAIRLQDSGAAGGAQGSSREEGEEGVEEEHEDAKSIHSSASGPSSHGRDRLGTGVAMPAADSLSERSGYSQRVPRSAAFDAASLRMAGTSSKAVENLQETWTMLEATLQAPSRDFSDDETSDDSDDGHPGGRRTPGKTDQGSSSSAPRHPHSGELEGGRPVTVGRVGGRNGKAIVDPSFLKTLNDIFDTSAASRDPGGLAAAPTAAAPSQPLDTTTTATTGITAGAGTVQAAATTTRTKAPSPDITAASRAIPAAVPTAAAAGHGHPRHQGAVSRSVSDVSARVAAGGMARGSLPVLQGGLFDDVDETHAPLEASEEGSGPASGGASGPSTHGPGQGGPAAWLPTGQGPAGILQTGHTAALLRGGATRPGGTRGSLDGGPVVVPDGGLGVPDVHGNNITNGGNGTLPQASGSLSSSEREGSSVEGTGVHVPVPAVQPRDAAQAQLRHTFSLPPYQGKGLFDEDDDDDEDEEREGRVGTLGGGRAAGVGSGSAALMGMSSHSRDSLTATAATLGGLMVSSVPPATVPSVPHAAALVLERSTTAGPMATGMAASWHSSVPDWSLNADSREKLGSGGAKQGHSHNPLPGRAPDELVSRVATVALKESLPPSVLSSDGSAAVTPSTSPGHEPASKESTLFGEDDQAAEDISAGKQQQGLSSAIAEPRAVRGNGRTESVNTTSSVGLKLDMLSQLQQPPPQQQIQAQAAPAFVKPRRGGLFDSSSDED